jgi:small subunit ribosomal protein S4
MSKPLNLWHQKLGMLKLKRGKRPKPLSGYGQQLVEKQKVRFMYGVSETQFANYVKKAVANKERPSAEYLFELLEI